MSPRTEKQFEEIRLEKQQLIMDTALQLFAEYGYKSTTISNIAKKAGISKGLLYNYFESKEELVEKILNDGLNTMMSTFDPNQDGVLEKEEMEFFIRETFKNVKENQKFWKLYWSISFQPDVFKLIEKKIDALLGPMTKMTVEYLRKQGFEKPEIEAMIFGAALDGIALDYIMKPDIYPIDIVLEEIIARYCK